MNLMAAFDYDGKKKAERVGRKAPIKAKKKAEKGDAKEISELFADLKAALLRIDNMSGDDRREWSGTIYAHQARTLPFGSFKEDHAWQRRAPELASAMDELALSVYEELLELRTMPQGDKNLQ